MPYKVDKDNPDCPKLKPYAVVKVGGSEPLGCHTTAKKAGAQIGTIERSEGKKEMTIDVKQLDLFEEENQDDSPEGKELFVADSSGRVVDSNDFVPWDITSFGEFDEVKAAREAAEEIEKDSDIFKSIVDNILGNEMVADKVEKIEALASEFGSRIRSMTQPKEKSRKVKGTSLFNVFYSKERNCYLFFVPYSNNILDHDLPKPEIIASKSHERFVDLVDSGKVPLPEVWLWHIPSLRIGEVEVVTYDKETGVAMAAGYFYKEAEPIAEIIAENPEQWGVSHSMDGTTIKKEVYDDKNVIVEHVTFEISPLPSFAAANKWAPGFRIVKEISMSIPKAKRAQLNKLGISDEMLEDVEQNNKTLAESVETLGIPTKEVSEEEVPVEDAPIEDEPAEDVSELEEESEPAEEAEPEVESEDKPESEDAPAEDVPEDAPAEKAPVEEDAPTENPAEGAFTEEQTKQLKEVFDALTANIVAQVREMVEPLQKSTEEAAKEMLHNAPPATLQDILFGGDALRKQSATTSDGTLVDRRTLLSKDGPAENSDKPLLVHSGSAIVDGVISDLLQPSEPVQ